MRFPPLSSVADEADFETVANLFTYQLPPGIQKEVRVVSDFATTGNPDDRTRPLTFDDQEECKQWAYSSK